MNSYINYFLDAIKSINNNEVPQYFLESKIKDLGALLTIRDCGDIILEMLCSEKPSDSFRYFEKKKALFYIFPILDCCKLISQNKHRSKNVFDHTIKVIDIIPRDNIDLRWAGLFHDLGKRDCSLFHNDFYKHSAISAKLFDSYSEMFNIQNKVKITKIILYHMLPLQYQKNQDWGEKGINNFISLCSKEFVFDVIEFAYYDKKAENDVEEFLQPILELREKVKEISGC